MKPIDYIIIGIVAAWAVAAAVYLVRAHKKGGSCCHCCEECRRVCSKRSKEK
jgi:myosin-crossreactive antigen